MDELLQEITTQVAALTPPVTVVGLSRTGTGDDVIVELRDGDVSWWVIRERRILDLVASPVFDAPPRYDTDLLRRFPFASQPCAPVHVEDPLDLMQRSVDDLMRELEPLRQPVARAFQHDAWENTRRHLDDLGCRRDAELFGRPYNPTG